MKYEDMELTKKRRELRVLQGLQALEPSLADSVFAPGLPGIEPDFVCRSPRPDLGIEVVECFRSDLIDGSPIKEQERFTDLVTAEATRRCIKRGMTNVLGFVEFDYSVRIRWSDISSLGESLATFVAPVAAGDVRLVETAFMGCLPRPISRAWAHRREGIDAPYIGKEWGGNVPEIDLSHLQQLISRKESKLPIYRQRCAQVWLAVLLDPFRVASMGYIPPEFRLIESRFDRVIALQGWSYTTELWRPAA